MRCSGTTNARNARSQATSRHVRPRPARPLDKPGGTRGPSSNLGAPTGIEPNRRSGRNHFLTSTSAIGRGGRRRATTASVAILATNQAIGFGSDTLLGIEGVIGTASDDTLRCDGKRNRLDGEGRNDHIEGSGGDDSLFGGVGTTSSTEATVRRVR
jgi:hypothetical protein